MLELVIVLVLIACNAFFALSEMSVVTSRKPRLKQMAADSTRARKARELAEHPERVLSTVQVGITSIGMLNGIFGEAAFSAGLAEWLMTVGVPNSVASVAATATVIIVITFLTIVFGELVPKRIGQMYPEASSRVIALPLTWVSKIAKPFVWLLAISAQAVLRQLCDRCSSPWSATRTSRPSTTAWRGTPGRSLPL